MFSASETVMEEKKEDEAGIPEVPELPAAGSKKAVVTTSALSEALLLRREGLGETKKRRRAKGKETDWEFMKHVQLRQLLELCRERVVVLDARDPIRDFVGGHIRGAVNIPYKHTALLKEKMLEFYSAYMRLTEKCAATGAVVWRFKYVVVHCMYSQCRGIRTAAALMDVVNGQAKAGRSETDQMLHDCGAIPKGPIAKVYVLQGGFWHWINQIRPDKKEYSTHSPLIADFDMEHWYVSETDTMYHKNDW